MQLRYYFQVLRRRRWVIIVTFSVTLLVVGVISLLSTPVYSSSTIVRIAQIQDRSIDYIDLNYSTRLINTYVELVRSSPFLEETIRRLELNIQPAHLANIVEASSVPSTELLKISASNTDPAISMRIANTLGELLIEEGEKFYSGQGKSAREILYDQLLALESDLTVNREQLRAFPTSEIGEDLSPEAQALSTRIELQEQIYGTVLDSYENARLADAARANSVSIVDPASIPVEPSSPNVPFNLALGALVGLAGGIGLAFLLENLETAIYSPDGLEEATEAPLLASVPDLKVPSDLKSSPLLLQPNSNSAAVEAFRILRSNVLTMDYGRPPRSLLITSVEDGAGKSTVLSNLAIAIGQAGKKVVAVDCDLRKPGLDRVFKVPNTAGLKSVIVDGESAEHAIQRTKIQGVSILPCGPLPHRPAELLGLTGFRLLVNDLANWADLVLLDSPPLAHFSDAIVLAPLVDGIILVVSRGSISGNHLSKAVSQLTKVGPEQIGIVFNRTRSRHADYR